MPLPDVGAARVAGARVPTFGGRFLVDLVDGQEPGRPPIGRSDSFHQLVADGPQGVAPLGHLGEVDVGVEVVEDHEVLIGGVGGRIDPQQIDGEGCHLGRSRLGDRPVPHRPGLAQPRLVRGLRRGGGGRVVTAADGAQEPGGSETPGGDGQELEVGVDPGGRRRRSGEPLGGRWIGRGASAHVPARPPGERGLHRQRSRRRPTRSSFLPGAMRPRIPTVRPGIRGRPGPAHSPGDPTGAAR